MKTLNFSVFACAFLAGLHLGETSWGVPNKINNPVATGQYFRVSNIASDGTVAVMGNDVRVRMQASDNDNAPMLSESPIIDVLPQNFNWAHNFPSISGGWPINPKPWCRLYNANNAFLDSVKVNVVQMPGM